MASSSNAESSSVHVVHFVNLPCDSRFHKFYQGALDVEDEFRIQLKDTHSPSVMILGGNGPDLPKTGRFSTSDTNVVVQLAEFLHGLGAQILIDGEEWQPGAPLPPPRSAQLRDQLITTYSSDENQVSDEPKVFWSTRPTTVGIIVTFRRKPRFRHTIEFCLLNSRSPQGYTRHRFNTIDDFVKWINLGRQIQLVGCALLEDGVGPHSGTQSGFCEVESKADRDSLREFLESRGARIYNMVSLFQKGHYSPFKGVAPVFTIPQYYNPYQAR